MLALQARVQLLVLGDVVVRGDPSAIRYHAVDDGNVAAVFEQRDPAPGGQLPKGHIETLYVFLWRVALRESALCEPIVQELKKTGPGPRLLRRQIVHLQIG